jgi:hypothetical protein
LARQQWQPWLLSGRVTGKSVLSAVKEQDGSDTSVLIYSCKIILKGHTDRREHSNNARVFTAQRDSTRKPAHLDVENWKHSHFDSNHLCPAFCLI